MIKLVGQHAAIDERHQASIRSCRTFSPFPMLLPQNKFHCHPSLPPRRAPLHFSPLHYPPNPPISIPLYAYLSAYVLLHLPLPIPILSVSSRDKSHLAGLPAHSSFFGTRHPGGTTVPAAICDPASITEPSATTAPAPILHLKTERTVHNTPNEVKRRASHRTWKGFR